MRSLAIRFFILLVLFFPALASAATPLNLTPGWNLLGNSSAAPIDVATTFGDTSKIITVWKWNKTASKWGFYAPSMTAPNLATYAANKGYDVLTSIDLKEGFWVNASVAVALTGPVATSVTLLESDLQQGWNLMGSADNKTPSQLNQSLSSSLNAAGKAIVTAWAWDAPTTKWEFYAPTLEAQGGAVLADYITGKGYLPFSTALSASDGFWLNIGEVTITTAALQSIAVTPGNPSIVAGLTNQFIATGTYSDGTSVVMTSGITWSSSNTSAATVNGSGLATGIASGAATITATSGVISGSTALAVTTAVLQSIVVTHGIPSTTKGLTKQQFAATGIYSDTSTADITLGVIWSSGNTSVATVSSSGLVSYSAVATGVAAGTSTITAALGTMSGSSTIMVPELQAIVVTPANQNLQIGFTQQMTATGQYSNGTTQDITATVSWVFFGKNGIPWGSFDVVQNLGGGLVKGLIMGTATAIAGIYALSGSIEGSTFIYVQ